MSLNERSRVALRSTKLITLTFIYESTPTSTQLSHWITIPPNFYHISLHIAVQDFLVFAPCRFCSKEHDVSNNHCRLNRTNRKEVFLQPIHLCKEEH